MLLSHLDASTEACLCRSPTPAATPSSLVGVPLLLQYFNARVCVLRPDRRASLRRATGFLICLQATTFSMMDVVMATVKAASNGLSDSYDFCHAQNVSYGHRVDDPSAAPSILTCMTGSWLH